MAVSYTHLDVYKRQVYTQGNYYQDCFITIKDLGVMILNDGYYDETCGSVSYTHL